MAGQRRLAFSVLRHRHDAEDVAQDASAKAYRAFRQLRDRDRFRAWLVRTTWRLALDRQRADRRRLARESTHAVTPTTSVPTTVEILAARQLSERLWKGIDALPEKLRLVIVLGSIDGHDVTEVAGWLECRRAR